VAIQQLSLARCDRFFLVLCHLTESALLPLFSLADPASLPTISLDECLQHRIASCLPHQLFERVPSRGDHKNYMALYLWHQASGPLAMPWVAGLCWPTLAALSRMTRCR